MNKDNTIFFTSCDNNYIPYAIVSLQKIRDFVPKARLAIISHHINKSNIKLLNSNNVFFYDLNLAEDYKKSWDYPVECFYFLDGPELFYGQGYKYSVYIDADVLCQKDPLLHNIQVEGIAGVPVDDIVNIFGKDYDVIKRLFNNKCTVEAKNKKRTQSGVLYFNKEYAKTNKMSKKCKQLFNTCLEAGIPRKGDDSLFALYVYLYVASKKIKYLDEIYNYIRIFHDSDPNKAIFFHFVELKKPWGNRTDNRYKQQYHIWKQKYHEILPVSTIIRLKKAYISDSIAKRLKH